ncbi:hypothetical protein PMIN05_007853 [Paraphaeosphaeria minitans]
MFRHAYRAVELQAQHIRRSDLMSSDSYTAVLTRVGTRADEAHRFHLSYPYLRDPRQRSQFIKLPRKRTIAIGMPVVEVYQLRRGHQGIPPVVLPWNLIVARVREKQLLAQKSRVVRGNVIVHLTMLLLDRDTVSIRHEHLMPVATDCSTEAAVRRGSSR